MKNRALLEQAQWLVNTSVQDMQSGLWNYTTQDDLKSLQLGYVMVRRRDEKTKAKILASKIKKLQKDLSKSSKLES